MQIKHVKHVKDRKKNLAFSIYSLVSIDKGSVSTKLFTLNDEMNMNLAHSADSALGDSVVSSSNQHAQQQGQIKVVRSRVSLA